MHARTASELSFNCLFGTQLTSYENEKLHMIHTHTQTKPRSAITQQEKKKRCTCHKTPQRLTGKIKIEISYACASINERMEDARIAVWNCRDTHCPWLCYPKKNGPSPSILSSCLEFRSIFNHSMLYLSMRRGHRRAQRTLNTHNSKSFRPFHFHHLYCTSQMHDRCILYNAAVQISRTDNTIDDLELRQ